jgi:hypothetical protein
MIASIAKDVLIALDASDVKIALDVLIVLVV